MPSLAEVAAKKPEPKGDVVVEIGPGVDGEGDPGEAAAADDCMAAVKSGDSKAFAAALKDFVAICTASKGTKEE